MYLLLFSLFSGHSSLYFMLIQNDLTWTYLVPVRGYYSTHYSLPFAPTPSSHPSHMQSTLPLLHIITFSLPQFPHRAEDNTTTLCG